MALVINRIIAGFDNNGNAQLTIPNGATSLALRFYETTELGSDPERSTPQISVTVLIDTLRPDSGNHTRSFILIPDGFSTPQNFKKFIATFPHGKNKNTVHVIEVYNDVMRPSLIPFQGLA